MRVSRAGSRRRLRLPAAAGNLGQAGPGEIRRRDPRGENHQPPAAPGEAPDGRPGTRVQFPPPPLRDVLEMRRLMLSKPGRPVTSTSVSLVRGQWDRAQVVTLAVFGQIWARLVES